MYLIPQVASAAVCPKVVVLLLLIPCFLLLSLFVGGVVFVPYFALQYLVSFTINLTILTRLVSEWQDSTQQTPWDHP